MVVSCYDIIKYCKMAEEKSPILGRTSLERRHKISQDIEQKKQKREFKFFKINRNCSHNIHSQWLVNWLVLFWNL